jgi:hypothetical protein
MVLRGKIDSGLAISFHLLVIVVLVVASVCFVTITEAKFPSKTSIPSRPNYISRYRDICLVMQEPVRNKYFEFYRVKRPLDGRASDPDQYYFIFLTEEFVNVTGYMAVTFVTADEDVAAANTTLHVVLFGNDTPGIKKLAFDTRQNLTQIVNNTTSTLEFTNSTIDISSMFFGFGERVTALVTDTKQKFRKIRLLGNFDSSVSYAEVQSGILPAPTFLKEFDMIGSNHISCMSSHGFFVKYRLYPQQFKRVTVYVSLTIDLIVFLVTLIGVVLLRNRKLISARFITPYVSLALLTVFRVLMSFDYPLVDETIYYISLSIIAVYCISCVIAFYSIESMRYFYIRNVYTIIAKMEDNNVTADESARRLAIHRKLISKPAVLILLAAIMITLLFPMFLYHIPIWVDVANPIGESTLDAVTNAAFFLVCFMPVVTCAIGSISFIIEFFINIPLIRKRGLSWYISFDDPLLVRSEVLIFTVVGIPLVLSAGGVFFSLLLGVIGLPQCINAYCIGAKGLTNMLTIGLILSPTSWILSFTMGGGFACIVELLRSSKCSTSNEAEGVPDLLGGDIGELSELKQVLENTDSYELFEQYCTRELSVENLKLWNRLASNARLSQSMDLEDFQKLYQQFIAQSSPFQVNIPSDTQKKLQSMLTKTGKVAWTDLRPLFLDIMHNLSDTYNRFKNTNEYTRFKARMGLKHSLMLDNYKISDTAETPSSPTTPKNMV